MRQTPFVIVAALAATCTTASARVSGKVFDRAGAVLSGVSVRQVLTGDADTTDAQGAWSLGTISVGASRDASSAGDAVSLRGNALRVVLEQPSPIVVEGLSVDGRRVPLLRVQGQAGPNDLLLDPSAVRPGGLLRIRTDRGAEIVSTLARLGSDHSSSAGANRAAAVSDTLVFEKAGFERVRRPMPADQDTFLVTMDSVLAAPRGLATSIVSASANTVAWSAVSGATGYEVRRCSSLGISCSDTSVSNPGYVQGGLSAGSTLRVRVRTISGERSSAWSDELVVHRSPLAPLSRGKVLDTLPAFEMPGNLSVTLPGWRKLASVRAYTEATPFQDTVLAPDTTIALRVGSGALPVFDTAWIRVVVYDSLGDSAACRIRVAERSLVVQVPRDTTVPFGTTAVSMTVRATSKAGIASVGIGGKVMPGTGGVYNFTVALVPGMNLVHLVVTDLAGASFRDTIRVELLPDKTGPVITRTTVPTSPTTWVKSTTVVYTVTDNDTVSSVTINGIAATRSGNTFKSAIPLEAGINPIVVVAKDRSGNVSKDSLAITTILKDRDGNTIRFGRMPDGRMWTLQNLQVKPSTSSIRTGATSTCVGGDCSWGRLYSWSMAMDLPAVCDTVSCVQKDSLSHQGLCPAGWHVPTHKEWKSLITASAAGASDSIGLARLRSTSAEGKWYSWERETCDPVFYAETVYSGTDKYRFTLLPTHLVGGSGQCGGAGLSRSEFWTATQATATRSSAIFFSTVFENTSSLKTNERVLRCIAN
jgi:uncharacterized protein (TIGR02145 family)